MSVNGINNSGTSPLFGIQTGPVTVSSTSTTTEEAPPILGTQEGEGNVPQDALDGELPPPPDAQSDPFGYQFWYDNYYAPYVGAKKQSNKNKEKQI